METGKKSRQGTVQHELVNELKALRASVRETAEGFILRKEGEIETLLDYLLKMPPTKLKAIARPWLREAQALKLKPAKGRIKDLKKIDHLLQDLLDGLIEADDPDQKPKPAGKIARLASSTKEAPLHEVQTI
jgi:hypothetical protein